MLFSTSINKTYYSNYVYTFSNLQPSHTVPFHPAHKAAENPEQHHKKRQIRAPGVQHDEVRPLHGPRPEDPVCRFLQAAAGFEAGYPMEWHIPGSQVTSWPAQTVCGVG